MTQPASDSSLKLYDIVIIGGGINGVGIAKDAAGRGLKVLLCEQDDLAAATSSASSKLIHGGLRYLEHYEFRLVREALQEREVLLAIGHHLVKPLRFRLPHAPHLRPAWMIRAGLFLYDYLAGRKTLPPSRCIKLDNHSPLQPMHTRVFEYSDCWVDDARLVIANAITACERGATILPRTRCESAQRTVRGWEIELSNTPDGARQHVYAKALVNASGPWVADFIEKNLSMKPEHGIRMIKGSHIAVPALHNGEEAYILQNTDGRIVFVIPWLDKWSMIGTTDVEYQGDPAQVIPSEEEEQYLIAIANQYFKKQTHREDIVHRFAGVRPLCNDESNNPSAITRDYTITVSDSSENLPLLNIFGGKLTTYRKLAESALSKLKPWFSEMGEPWTDHVVLAGGEIISKESFIENLLHGFPWLPKEIANRYVSNYGDLCHRFLLPCNSLADMGQHFGNGLYQAEVDYLIDHEWAVEADDILWRRTKTGLGLPEQKKEQLISYLHSRNLQKRNTPR